MGYHLKGAARPCLTIKGQPINILNCLNNWKNKIISQASLRFTAPSEDLFTHILHAASHMPKITLRYDPDSPVLYIRENIQLIKEFLLSISSDMDAEFPFRNSLRLSNDFD